MGNVIFYSCTDANNKLNKTPTQIKSINVNFKGGVSETDPVIFVSNFDFSNVNYMYISDYNRYYFIKEIVTVPGGLQISGHVDVLMSFKNEINNVGGIVSRSSNIQNNYLSDPKIKLLQYKKYETKKSTGSFDTDLNYYLVVAG